MGRTVLLLTSLVIAFSGIGQLSHNSQWTFVKGDSVMNKLGVYGVKGLANTTNKPGARKNAITWTDNSGNLWLYGGEGYGKTSTIGSLNDVWKYSPQNNLWTWMHGADTANAPTVFGSIGVSDISNTPGVITSGTSSWKDVAGNFWGIGKSATVWKYDIQTNQWTWMKGDTATSSVSSYWGRHGTKGVADISNDPGTAGSMYWTDKDGKFWMLKTTGQTYAGTGFMNDLWKFDPQTNNWTWMSGDSALLLNGRSVYGTKGVGSSNNYPGSRKEAVTWADQNGNLWAFGGEGTAWIQQFSTYIDFYLGDLWKYSTSTAQWTWVSGDSTTGFSQYGNYGTQGVTTASNKPGIRRGASGVPDAQGNLWLFQGWGASSVNVTEILNDYWKYDIATGQWTWMKGDNAGNKKGIYGMQGIPDVANKPGSRRYLSAWANGSIWAFGGEGQDAQGNFGLLNDLWKLSNTYTFIGLGSWGVSSNWLGQTGPAPTTIDKNTTVIIDPQFGPKVCQLEGIPLTILQGGTLTVKSGRLRLAGLTNNGFVNGAGSIEFSCVGCSSIGLTKINLSSSSMLALPMEFRRSYVYLLNHIEAKDLTFSEGSKIELGQYDLNLGSAALNGVDEDNFIIANSTGKLIRSVGTSPVLYPVSNDSISYTPITISKLPSTSGNPDTVSLFGVGVKSGVQVGGNMVTQGVVNRTWSVSRSDTSAFRIAASWNVADELTGFMRSSAMVSLVCPPPDNCITGFDVVAPQAATGTGPFTIERVGPFVSSASSFIVRSGPVKFEFTGSVDNDWGKVANWTGGFVPPNTITNGMEVIINNDCQLIGNVLVKPGGKLSVKSGKKITVIGSLVLE